MAGKYWKHWLGTNKTWAPSLDRYCTAVTNSCAVYWKLASETCRWVAVDPILKYKEVWWVMGNRCASQPTAGSGRMPRLPPPQHCSLTHIREEVKKEGESEHRKKEPAQEASGTITVWGWQLVSVWIFYHGGQWRLNTLLKNVFHFAGMSREAKALKVLCDIKVCLNNRLTVLSESSMRF